MPNLKEIIGEEAFKALPEDTRNKYKETDFVNSADYVPKERFSQVTEEKNEYKKQVGERDKQIKDLGEKAKGHDELTAEIERLKTANSTTVSDYEKKLQEQSYQTIIRNALKESGAKDPKLIEALLDREKIKISGEEAIGLKEQLEGIKKERDYLFEKEVLGTGKFNPGGKSSSVETDPLPLGERLAKQKTEQLKASEDANKFFK